MRRELEIRHKAEKDLQGIPKRDGERISKAIMALQSGLTGDVKRLTNFTPEYRLRVGDWQDSGCMRVMISRKRGIGILVIAIGYCAFGEAGGYFHFGGWRWAEIATAIFFILIVWAWNILAKRSEKAIGRAPV